MPESHTPRKKISSISAVFPVYNDAGTIPSMVLTALLALRQVTDDYEVIVTNDGSKDNTKEVLDELASRYPELKVFHHPESGYGQPCEPDLPTPARIGSFTPMATPNITQPN